MKIMRLRFVFVPIILLVLIVGCATGPAFTPLQIPTNQAILYFYRPSHFVGAAGSWILAIDGQPVVNLTNGGYFPYMIDGTKETTFTMVDPLSGKNRSNTIIVSSIVAGPLGAAAAAIGTALSKDIQAGTFQFEPGKTYYFRYEITSPTKSTIKPVSPEVGASEVQKCRLLRALN